MVSQDPRTLTSAAHGTPLLMGRVIVSHGLLLGLGFCGAVVGVLFFNVGNLTVPIGRWLGAAVLVGLAIMAFGFTAMAKLKNPPDRWTLVLQVPYGLFRSSSLRVQLPSRESLLEAVRASKAAISAPNLPNLPNSRFQDFCPADHLVMRFSSCFILWIFHPDSHTLRSIDSSTPSCRLAVLPSCRLADLPTCRLADLPTCRLADLLTC